MPLRRVFILAAVGATCAVASSGLAFASYGNGDGCVSADPAGAFTRACGPGTTTNDGAGGNFAERRAGTVSVFDARDGGLFSDFAYLWAGAAQSSETRGADSDDQTVAGVHLYGVALYAPAIDTGVAVGTEVNAAQDRSTFMGNHHKVTVVSGGAGAGTFDSQGDGTGESVDAAAYQERDDVHGCGQGVSVGAFGAAETTVNPSAGGCPADMPDAPPVP